jgi:heat shock protein HtpX
MNRQEIEGVLAHEISHVANGDMVTMTLVQGVVNAFVLYLSHIVAMIARNALSSRDDDRPSFLGMIASQLVFIAAQIAFGLIGSMITAWFSRQREFRADAGASRFMGTPRPMVSALRRLGGLEPGELPKAFQSSGISDKPGFMALFSTHPPIEERIAALETRG